MILGDANNEETLEWLLEPESPGVRYLAMRDLTNISAHELKSARDLAHEQGPIVTILEAMDPEGFWVKSGPGYLPKYRSNVWSIIMLALLGASASEDERIDGACGWGATKVMLAFGILPEDRRTTQINNAIERGVEFLFSVDPAEVTYPSGNNKKPGRNWWKFGFSVFYITNLLQIVEALVQLGYGSDRRLKSAIDLIIDKRDDRGCWALECSYKGKTWLDFGELKEPNEWVTLRAMRVLKALNDQEE